MSDDLTRLVDSLNELADSWDTKLQREFGVDEEYTDWHARELREVVAEATADRPKRQRGGVIFGEPFISAPKDERGRRE